MVSSAIRRWRRADHRPISASTISGAKPVRKSKRSGEVNAFCADHAARPGLVRKAKTRYAPYNARAEARQRDENAFTPRNFSALNQQRDEIRAEDAGKRRAIGFARQRREQAQAHWR